MVNTVGSSLNFKEMSSTTVEKSMGKLKTTTSLGNDKISRFFNSLALPDICDSPAKT